MLVQNGGEEVELSDEDLKREVFKALDILEKEKPRHKILVIPPDYTRFHSKAGIITQYVYQYYGEKIRDIIPALGTHHPMTGEQLTKMFGDIPKSLFRVHNWRNDVITIGKVPAKLVLEASEGKANEEWPAQLNKLVWNGGHDLILSIGQVVPHEVMGMGNYNKNLLVGVGGSEAIHFSHFIGAIYGMERMMGRANNPLRRILDYATDHFIKPKLPVVYIQTVIGNLKQQSDSLKDDEMLDEKIKMLAEENAKLRQDMKVLQAQYEKHLKKEDEKSKEMIGTTPKSEDDKHRGDLVAKGIFISKDRDCFEEAAKLSLKVNFTLLDKPLKKVVVYLDGDKYTSTWIGNKAVYRTRMAIEDGGELVIMAPGVNTFGEDKEIDRVIRKYGYRTTPEVLDHLKNSRDLMRNLSAAAHLIHASSENRFKITWCPGKLSREEIESVGFEYGDLKEMLKRYDINTLKDGENEIRLENGEIETIFFVPNPALGLWAYRGRFEETESFKAHIPENPKRTEYVEASKSDVRTADVGVGGGPFEAPYLPSAEPKAKDMQDETERPTKKARTESSFKLSNYEWTSNGWGIVVTGASEMGYGEAMVRMMYGEATNEGDTLTDLQMTLFKMKAPNATNEQMAEALVERGVMRRRNS